MIGSSPGLDAIPAGALCLVLRNYQGTYRLTKLIIQSLVSGVFPECYKTAMIYLCPILGFRPISLLS